MHSTYPIDFTGTCQSTNNGTQYWLVDSAQPLRESRIDLGIHQCRMVNYSVVLRMILVCQAMQIVNRAALIL